MALSAADTGATIRDWHVGPVFVGAMGYHQFVVEFLNEPADLLRFRNRLDEELSNRNADYLAHRIPGVGLAPPAVIVAKSGSFEAWMRRRGKLGGQNKVPRMDNTVRSQVIWFGSSTRQDGLVSSCRLSSRN